MPLCLGVSVTAAEPSGVQPLTARSWPGSGSLLLTYTISQNTDIRQGRSVTTTDQDKNKITPESCLNTTKWEHCANHKNDQTSPSWLRADAASFPIRVLAPFTSRASLFCQHLIQSTALPPQTLPKSPKSAQPLENLSLTPPYSDVACVRVSFITSQYIQWRAPPPTHTDCSTCPFALCQSSYHSQSHAAHSLNSQFAKLNNGPL